ncbi:hypothetical protein [Phormidesmis priestleyi]
MRVSFSILQHTNRPVLASLLGLLITTIPTLAVSAKQHVSVQAQSSQSCSQQFAEDFAQRNPYPTQPLPTIVASSWVLAQIAELAEIAQLPSAKDSIVQTQLDNWLIGRPNGSSVALGAPPQIERLLAGLSQDSEKAQLLNSLDRLAVRLERLHRLRSHDF